MKVEILLTGSFGVGKSSIFNQLIYNEFTTVYDDTIGVRIEEKNIEVPNHSITLKIWDITGEIEQNRVPLPYYRKKDIILYITDLSRPFTFQNVHKDISYLKEIAPEAIIKVIGNKKDVLTEVELLEAEKAIEHLQIDQLVSAKTNENIDALFHTLAKEVLVQKRANS